MKDRSRFIRLCVRGLESKGLNKDERYKSRLQKEIKAVDEQAEHEYFLDLYDNFSAKGLFFPENEHNNLIDYVLGLSDNFNIEEDSAYVQGESPDIDIDYIKSVRDYLKREWAPKEFGQENICAIGTYGTSGIKMSMLDMARVHGENVHEIQNITTQIEDKDEEGKLLEWDKIFEIATFNLASKEETKKIRENLEKGQVYDWPEKFKEIKSDAPSEPTDSPHVKFAEYCNKHPDVASAAKLLLSRNRQAGVHAGGLIISNQPIDGFVPLEVRSVREKDNPKGDICSAWTEGLNTQDLQPVGLIKFDLLVLNNLMQIALACHLVKKRHGLDSICALDGNWDWSDVSYLEDPALIAMANKGDLKCIFQFDGEGMRRLVKRGGVTRFEDLVSYSSLYRPGPLNLSMDARYCKRKKWSLDEADPDGEPYSLHPLLEKILGKTYGILIFQEQVMEILRTVGKIPDMHTEKVRKAISKKKIEQFIKYKEIFIENGQETLGVNKEFVEDLWSQIESFAEYGFNAAHATAYAYISARLLYLKAHYPLEFYAAILQCEKDTDRFRDYKLDAKYHGVEVCPVSINKSKENFWIEDEKIYFGFMNIKGIGEGVAKRIVENQPYSSFSDFLYRFGTDAGPLKALIALGVFDDLELGCDREQLRRFHEYSKDKFSKRRQRQQRYEASIIDRQNQLSDLLLTEITEEDPDFKEMNAYTKEAEVFWKERFEDVIREVPYRYKGEDRIRKVTLYKLLMNLAAKRVSNEKNFKEKENFDDENPVVLERFNVPVSLDKDELDLLRDNMIVDGRRTYPMAESQYYGFQWNHVLETCPNYDPNKTIDNFLSLTDKIDVAASPIQVYVRSVRARTSKKGTKFWSVEVEDANGRVMRINVWSDDYLRWEDLWVKGSKLQLKVNPPSGGFNTLTLKSLGSRIVRRNTPKEDDYRVVKMKEPKKVVEKDDEVASFTLPEGL